MNTSFPVPLRSPRVLHFRPAPPEESCSSVRRIGAKEVPNVNRNNKNITPNASSSYFFQEAHNPSNQPKAPVATNSPPKISQSHSVSIQDSSGDPIRKRSPPNSAKTNNPRLKKISQAKSQQPPPLLQQQQMPSNNASIQKVKSGNVSARAVNHRLNTAKTNKPQAFKDPITPEEALANYAHIITKYETTEIKEYSQIYFLGIYTKKNKTSMISNVNNYGFDDSAHHYKTQQGDHIAYRYEIKSNFGKGAFGQVIKAYDHKEKMDVALKIIINTKQMHEQGLIETNILTTLNDGSDPQHNNYIVRVMDSFKFRNHVCVTFEILGQNLYEYSRSLHYKPLPMNQLRGIAQQMFTALQFCHETKRVIHCDMKPENVLLVSKSNKNCIRVIDFGSSCFVGRQKYEYIQSRFYRAPEVILGQKYGPPMDIWSVGCILCELESGRPIFPGDDENEQIRLFMEVLGLPPRYLLYQCARRKEFFHEDGTPITYSKNKKINIGTKSIKMATRISDPLLLDLLSKCLEWDQTKRITAAQALKHPFFTSKEISLPPAKSANQLPDLKK